MTQPSEPYYPRGSVLLVDLDPVVGHEQGRRRPCVVVSDLDAVRASRARPLYTVVPFTSSGSLIGPLAPRVQAREGGMPADSTALVMHVRSIDPARVLRRVGVLEAGELAPITAGVLALVRE